MSIGLTFLKRIMSRGRHREANTQSTSSAANQPNSGTGGSGTDNTIYTYTNQAPTCCIWNGYIVWSNTTEHPGTCQLTGKWVPPWRISLDRPNVSSPYHGPVHPEAQTMVGKYILAGEILAYRAWYWDAQTKRLRSIFVNYEWPPDEPAIGDPGAGFGLHGFKYQDAANIEYQSIARDLVFGEALFWGDVVEFERGYTAEFGKVRNIYSVTGNEPVDEIRKVYRL